MYTIYHIINELKASINCLTSSIAKLTNLLKNGKEL